MTNIYGNHDLKFDRFGEEELETSDDNGLQSTEGRVELIDRIKRTLGFPKSYVSLKHIYTTNRNNRLPFFANIELIEQF